VNAYWPQRASGLATTAVVKEYDGTILFDPYAECEVNGCNHDLQPGVSCAEMLGSVGPWPAMQHDDSMLADLPCP
jgi:hypothetical protein